MPKSLKFFLHLVDLVQMFFIIGCQHRATSFTVELIFMCAVPFVYP